MRRGSSFRTVRVEPTVLVVEVDGFAVRRALENPPTAIAKPVFEVGNDHPVCVAAALGPASPA